MLRVAGQAFVREAYLFFISRGPTRATIISIVVGGANAITRTIAKFAARGITIVASE